jgi:competence protein ComEA
MVVVKGAVARPGAQQLPPGSVVASAIVAAGGLAPNANIGAVNLQQPLRQGMTITVPVNKVVMASEKITPSPVPKSPETPESAPASPININNATVAQLQSLPGIGPSLATRIITYRKEVGDFRTPEQLMDVKGITPDKFRQIQALVRTE